MNIFKSLKILLALGEKMYSLRNGAPLKERNKIKFHRSLRGEGGVFLSFLTSLDISYVDTIWLWGGETSSPRGSEYFNEIFSQNHIKRTYNNSNKDFKSVKRP